jgi:sugar phosphate isomerase/epimerase
MRELVESYGLAISGFCAQLVGPSTPGHGWPGSALGNLQGLKERVEKTKKSLKLAADFGSPVVTTHPGEILSDKTVPAYKAMKKSCSEIARYGEEVGGIFCIETGQEQAQTLRSFLEDVGSEALMVNFDPANMLRHGVVEGVKTLGPWIVHTHAKDHNPKTNIATVGEGLVPWDEYIATLRSIGYDGWYALEDETGKDVINSLKRGRIFLERY